MKASELRKKYIDYFVSKGHVKINYAPLVPENDPTVLFTTAGMHPLVPFLIGEKHPSGKRLVSYQKCIRTADIDEVGDDYHTTLFEMLGNWSLGDPSSPDGIGQGGYFKKDSIKYSWEFLTKVLNIKKEKLAVSVFLGDKDSPKDNQSAGIWQSAGINKNRIAYLGKEDNWWGPAGAIGPCGPDTEIFYYKKDSKAPDKFDPADSDWVEIWNNVFMQYDKNTSGDYEELKQKNVDTGMGLERTLMILNNCSSVYETEVFLPIMDKIKKLSNNYNEKYARIIADHIKASVFIIADGIKPSNVDQGYILRRLTRRIIRYANMLEFDDDNYLRLLANKVISIYKKTYPEIDKIKMISEIFSKEKNKFDKALKLGEKEFSKIINNLKNHNQDSMSGRLAFKLFESYGLPIEMIAEMAKEENFTVDKDGFDKAYQSHQLLSRKGAKKKFKGGLADDSEIATKYHTATHLLHQALRNVLGDHIAQKGSNITSERLRFDFSHPKKLTEKEKSKVEKIVSRQIKSALPVKMKKMDLKTAKAEGALGFFESKYGKIVNVYTIGKNDNDYFSKEICGGPHVKNTKGLGEFKITSEKSSSSGVRRIKAVLK